MLSTKFFAGILYSSDDIVPKAIVALEELFGEVDFQTTPYDFDGFTRYYVPEMGTNLKKLFIFFKKELRGTIADAKEKTILIEKQLSVNGKRIANIDPGYINEKEMGLPSTKPTEFRKVLSDNLYNQVIYTYDGELHDAPKAFPDFRSDAVKEVFAKVFKSLQE